MPADCALRQTGSVRQLDAYDCIIDARSPSEFALDRIPGAVNWPTLDDDAAAAVGTEYKQVSPFDARKRGAALAARNIAGPHRARTRPARAATGGPWSIAGAAASAAARWRWCSTRSASGSVVLEGGYQAFRRAMVAALDDAIAAARLPRVVRHHRIRQEPAAADPAVRSASRCSTWRHWPSTGVRCSAWCRAVEQPSQKAFDTRIWDQLRRFDPARAGLGREREQQGRCTARARGVDRRDPQRAVLAHRAEPRCAGQRC